MANASESIPSQSAPSESSTPELPIRVGVFDSIAGAEKAVEILLSHGFYDREITVFCSNEEQQAHFSAEERPPGESGKRGANVKTAASGSAIGSALGGLTAIAGLATLGGLPVLVAGGMAGALTGGVVGGLTGAMMSRGLEKAPADFFDQAVAEGQILVAVEPDPPNTARSGMAATVLRQAGAEPIPLPEG